MTGGRSPDNQRPLQESFETGRSRRDGTGKKVRRVSQRRELAIVTLGVVASITGLGGVLAANPPSWAVSEANAQPDATTQEADVSANSSSLQSDTAGLSSGTESTSTAARPTPAPDQRETSQAPARRSSIQQLVQRSTPVALGLLIRLEAFSEILSFIGTSGWESALATATNGIAWGVARSAGFVAFLSATGAVLLGTRHPARLPVGGRPVRVCALHRALGMASVLALSVHLIGLWLDSYVRFGWEQLLVFPWTSTYRPVAVTLGWLAMLALLLTAASGGLRHLLPGWRIVHALAYLTFALGLTHGLLAGSDTGSLWAVAFYLAALLAVGWTVLRRFSRSNAHYHRERLGQEGFPIDPPQSPESTGKSRIKRHFSAYVK